MTDQFLDIRGGGIDFGKNIVKMHPKLKTALSRPDERKKIIKSYFHSYYVSHAKEMDAKIEAIKNAWRKKEDAYVLATEKYFGGFSFPAGKYIAYASVVNCNPRFLDSKTFQFFYKKTMPDAIHTIAHELLHFIFFDFVEKEMKEDIEKLSEDQLWDLSEIFNVILLRSPQYQGIIDSKQVRAYPDHEPYLKKFDQAHSQAKSARDFITRGVVIIKK